MTETEKLEQVRRTAQHHFCASPDWVTFFREVLGLKGIIRRLFPTRQLLAKFERSEVYAEVQQMLTTLRARGPESVDGEEEPTKVITVRLPKSLHDALKEEAHEYRTSMNRLCISKLLQFIDSQFVPTPEGSPAPYVSQGSREAGVDL